MQLNGLLTRLRPRSAALLESILTNGSSGIERRNLALHSIGDAFGHGAEALNQNFEREAPALASTALLEALQKSGKLAREVDALFVATCTGYLCPGVSSHLAEQTGMRDDVYLADLVGLGCGAAIPLMRAAEGYLAANPGAVHKAGYGFHGEMLPSTTRGQTSLAMSSMERRASAGSSQSWPV